MCGAMAMGCGGSDDSAPAGWGSSPSSGSSSGAGSSSGGGGASSSGSSSGGGGAPDAGSGDDAAGSLDAGSTFVEAPHPSAPQIQRGSGDALTNPKFVAVTWDGDSIRPDLESLLSTIGTTTYWSQVTAEYGVGPATALTPVHVSTPAPTTIDDSAADSVATWLQGMLDGTHPEFGTPDSSTVYVIVYPPQTTTMSCYHSNIVVGATQVPYAVSAGCGGTNERLYPVSHEIIEASTDPFPGTPAYAQVADADYAYPVATAEYEAEIGDLCQVLDTKYQTVGGVVVTTAWSNLAAQQGHDPCVPNQMNRTYFNSFPVLPDQVPIVDNLDNSHTANGLRIPIGQQKTIELDLFSDGPTAEWTVTALDVNVAQGKPAALTFAFDKTQGKNGDKIHVTVSAVGTGVIAGGVAMFMIQSNMSDPTQDPSAQTQVPVVVVNN
jgi:hypothetical protein